MISPHRILMQRKCYFGISFRYSQAVSSSSKDCVPSMFGPEGSHDLSYHRNLATFDSIRVEVTKQLVREKGESGFCPFRVPVKKA